METKRNVSESASKRIVFFLCCLLPSCALLDGYRSNQHATYHNILTEEHKAQIAMYDSIKLPYYEKIHNRNLEGIVLVTKYKRRNRYNFVERGVWTETPFEGLDTVENYIISRTKCFDRYGNLRSKKTFVSYEGESSMHQNDEWSSKIDLIDGDSMLVQHIKNYFTDGQVSHQLSVAIPEYKEMRSDYLKTKYKIGWEYEYDRDGSVLDSTMYQLSDSVTKQNYF